MLPKIHLLVPASSQDRKNWGTFVHFSRLSGVIGLDMHILICFSSATEYSNPRGRPTMRHCILMIGGEISTGLDQVVNERSYFVTHVNHPLMHLRPLHGNYEPICGILVPASRHFANRNGDGDQPRRFPYM